MNFRDYAPADLRAISQRAGVASGAARRKKREAIEREKIMNAALCEQRKEIQRQHHENVRIIRQAARMLLQSKRALDRARR